MDQEAFMKHVNEIQRRDGCDGMTGMHRARLEFPEAYQSFQNADVAPPVVSFEKSNKAEAEFELLVDGIVARDKVNRHTAMQRARREQPSLFAAYRSG
jgi:hypothetical protein